MPNTEYLWSGDIHFSHGTSATRGTCILFKKQTDIKIHTSACDDNGKYVILNLCVDSVRLTLANIHAPNEDDPVFYFDLCQNIENLSNQTRIIGEDFNLVLNLELDKKGGRDRTNFKWLWNETVNNWCEQTDLVDIWRLQHPDSQKFTCGTGKTHLKSSAALTFSYHLV